MPRTTLRSLAATAALFAPLAPVTAQNLGATFDNNVDGYIELAYAPELIPQSGITFEAWITYDETTIGPSWRYPTIMRHGNSGGGSENMYLRVDANNNGARVLTWMVVTTTAIDDVAMVQKSTNAVRGNQQAANKQDHDHDHGCRVTAQCKNCFNHELTPGLHLFFLYLCLMSDELTFFPVGRYSGIHQNSYGKAPDCCLRRFVATAVHADSSRSGMSCPVAKQDAAVRPKRLG
jgi:hypothetical protein